MNIFAAKLSSDTTGEDLNELFSQFGQVISSKVIMDKDTGMSKRFGFVEMSNDDEGNRAIDQLNETEFKGSVIVVKKAHPKESAGPKFGRNEGRKDYNKKFQKKY